MKKKNANKIKVSTIIFIVLLSSICLISIGAINNGKLYTYKEPVTYDVLKSHLSNGSNKQYVNIDAITPGNGDSSSNAKQNIMHNVSWYCCEPFTVLTSGLASYKISEKEISEINTVAAYIANYEKDNWNSVYYSNETRNHAIKKYTQLAMWLAMSDGELSSALNINLGGTRQQIINKYSNEAAYDKAKEKLTKAEALLSEAKKFASTRKNGELKISIDDNNNNVKVTITNLSDVDKVEVDKGDGFSTLSMKIDSNGTGTADISKNSIQNKITVRVSKVSYSVKMIKLTHANLQDLLCMNPSSKIDTFTKTFDVNTDVSLQKYIYSVNGNKVSNGDVKYYLRGDVDGDGDVDLSDYMEIVNYTAKLSSKLSEIKDENTRKYIADLDNDGRIAAADTIIVKDMAVRLVSKEYYYFDSNGNVKYCSDPSEPRKNTILKPTPAQNADKSQQYEYGWWSPSINKAPSSYNRASNFIKQDNPVEIEVGDTVRYKIQVYNNSNVDANVVLQDAPYFSLITENDKYNIKIYYENGNSTTELTGWQITKNADGKPVNIQIPIGTLKGNTSKTILVDLKYTKEPQNEEKINNEVCIKSTNPKNETQYRTYDGDSIKFKKHSVSLEKYVSKVESADLKDYVNISGREGKRYNWTASDKNNIENYNTYKKDNPVLLENGDKVTFTIKLKNTGLNPVKITQLDDWHSKALTVDDTYKIDNGGTVEKKGGDGDQWDIIKFSQPKLLAAGETVNITIRYNLNVDKNNKKLDFFNKAQIKEIRNKNNYVVKDWDGTDNNQDEDHIKLKEYKVSLEKFVTNVTDANGNNAQSYTDREYKRYNESAKTTSNKNEFKPNNVVEVEAGDLVTFTIKIKNEDTTEREKNTDIYVKEITDIPVSKNGNSLEYVDNNIGATVKNENGNYKVVFATPLKITAQNCYYFTMRFRVNVPVGNTTSAQKFSNKAKVTNIYNKNKLEVNDSDGADNNADEDFIKTKVYIVSLEKYIEKVVLSNGEVKDGFNREGLAEHMYDNDSSTNNNYKQNNVVKADCGSQITYIIKIKNDGDTKVKITGVQDYLPPNTISYKVDSYDEKTNTLYGGKYSRRIYIVNLDNNTRRTKGYYFSHDEEKEYGYRIGELYFDDQENKDNNSYNPYGVELAPGGTKEFKVTITTNASNLSLDVYKNEAQVNYIENRNNLTVKDITSNDNQDRDYFKMDSPTETPIDICVHKVWKNVSEKEIENETIKVTLYRNENAVETVDLTKSNNWMYVWKNLAKKDEKGNTYTYKVDETKVPNGFTKEIKHDSEYEYKIINTKTKTTSVSVNKVWKDNDNEKAKRPNSVKVGLYQNDQAYNNQVVTLSSANEWKHTWTDLPKFDSNNVEYKYTVKELSELSGYESSVSVIDNKNGETGIKFNITNTYTGKETEKVSKTVTKIWDDDNNKYGDRPPSINVELYANGNKTGKTATLNSSNSWTYIWNDLDKYSESGNQIIYTVKEIEKINNYIVKYDSNKECDTITNIYNKTHISVYKEWDVEDQSLKKPVKVTLYRNGTALSTAELKEDNSWNHTWDNLDVYDNNQNKYTYTIQETTLLENIESSIYGSGDKYTIINKQIDDEDPIIAGIVWNDVALDKTSTSYNCQYDNGKESLLSEIKVYLYRIGVSKAVAQTTTDSNGYYRFRNIDLDPNVITDPTERHIKAKVSSTTDNKWDKTYYSYIVKFEYDGIKYTSTFKDKKRWWKIDDNSTASQYAAAQYSNAEEKESDRKELNNRFSTINNRSGINYETINVSDDRIPQSRYTYDSSTMSITSSTNTINIADYKDKELTLQHVNLGLRGRDTLDLELTSDVYSVDVTVNEQTGTYYYNNEVTIAKDDIGVYQDAANITNERYTDKDGNDINLENINNATVNQNVRATDIYNEAYGNGNTGLGINVTYKITVLNSGVTDARATKIVNYYDNRYEFVKATYDGNELPSKITKGENGYSECLITTNGSMLANGASMNIYVTYKLNEATKTDLKKMDINGELATYNMSEIYQYQSQCAKGQSVFTRGLIDVDSAPGSANTEKARLKGNKTDNNTTVQYFFNANNLDQLKYEDDTYATPVLYFVKDDSKRKLSGNVFEDLTTVNAEKVKTGNGIKDDNEKINVYGATVELLENGTVLRYRTTTDTDGNYSFEGFLPGNYMVRFRYGDTDNTVILKTQSDKINPKSFNGEDYQATNNTGEYGAKKISDRQDYWYLDNENGKVSTATDNTARRVEISNNVYNDPDIMNVLNDIRDGKKRADCGADKVDNLIEKTKMYADTKSLLINVEKAFLENNEVKQSNSFGNYAIGNMNFGIAEVPVSTIDLQKHVDELEIVDSAGINTIAKIKLQNDNKYKVYAGEVLAAGANEPIDVSIENEKLQGAKLRITYVITANINAEKNFDGKEVINPTINGLVDFIDNNLEYNDTLGENSKYWQLISYDDMQKAYNSLKRENDGFTPASTVVNNANTHKVIIEAKEDNPILKLKDGATSVKLVLEKVLSSNDSGIEGIKMDTQNMFGYGNIIEIKGLTYNTPKGQGEGQGENPLRDRVRTTDRHIIVPGGSRDTATSEEIVIHPPTGDGGTIGITYYIVGLASLCILAIGVFGIKKFIIKR